MVENIIPFHIDLMKERGIDIKFREDGSISFVDKIGGTEFKAKYNKRFFFSKGIWFIGDNR